MPHEPLYAPGPARIGTRRRDRHGGRGTRTPAASRVPLAVEIVMRAAGERIFDGEPGDKCPRRDSNPRYSLERAVTWAASRRRPEEKRRTERRPTPLAADAEVGSDDRRGRPWYTPGPGRDVHQLHADLPPARTKQDPAMRRAVHPELIANSALMLGEAQARFSPTLQKRPYLPGTSTRPAARTRPGRGRVLEVAALRHRERMGPGHLREVQIESERTQAVLPPELVDRRQRDCPRESGTWVDRLVARRAPCGTATTMGPPPPPLRRQRFPQRSTP